MIQIVIFFEIWLRIASRVPLCESLLKLRIAKLKKEKFCELSFHILIALKIIRNSLDREGCTLSLRVCW